MLYFLHSMWLPSEQLHHMICPSETLIANGSRRASPYYPHIRIVVLTSNNLILLRSSKAVTTESETDIMASENSPHPLNESSRHPRRFSLVHQASCETQHYAGLKRQNTIKHRQQLEGDLVRGRQILQKLNDEGVELIWAANQGRIAFSMVLSSSGGIVKTGFIQLHQLLKFTTFSSIKCCKHGAIFREQLSTLLYFLKLFTASLPLFISATMASFQVSSIKIEHLETRKSGREKDIGTVESWDILVDCDGSKDDLVTSAAALIQNHSELKGLALYKKDQTDDVPWFPRHVSDLDKCSNCTTKYEPTTDPRHPGHADDAYIARRKFLNDQALEYKYGDPIPIVEYLEEEHSTWRAVYEKLRELHESHTCDTYRKNLKILEEEGVLNPARIPQIKDVNEYLRKRTGFMLRPCSGLLSARDFLASLAFRVFQTTTYLRHSGSPHHSPEPDLIHELLGHVPMFADPLLAQLSQDIGLMSLGATDKQIEKLATVYWFIVEFGLCRERGSLKAIGAGLLSAYGELMHACSDLPEHRDFDPATTAVQKYEDDDYQPLYFVAESIQDAMCKLRLYAVSMERPFSVIYDPYTQTVEVISNTSDLRSTFERFQNEFSAITNAVDRINKHQEST